MDAETRPFYCERCGKWWQTWRWNVSCCVHHAGGCCHFNDREVEKPEGITPLADIDFGRFG